MSSSSEGDYVATLIAGQSAKLSPQFIREKTSLLEQGRIAWLEPSEVLDIFSENVTSDVLFKNLTPSRDEKKTDTPYDVLIQKAASRRKKFLIADMESTIIQEEMLDELAAMIGMGEQVAGITEKAMNGEIDFSGALRERAILLKGQPETLLSTAAKKITYMPGARELIATMKSSGAQCWLVSGGFSCFVKEVAEDLGFDRFYANELLIEDGKITGEIKDPIMDKTTKEMYLEMACRELEITLEETLAIGDGANDVLMLEACEKGGGLGVAYHAKPKVRSLIQNQVNQTDLKSLLFAQGYKRSAFISSY